MRTARFIAAAMAVMCVCLMVTSANAVEGPFETSASRSTANAVTLIYDPASGNMETDTGGESITTFQVKSAAGNFMADGVNDDLLVGLFDVLNDGKLFKLDPAGYGNTSWGAIHPAGLSQDALLGDLLVDGSYVGGGDLASKTGGGPYLHVVPEPSSIALMALGLLGFLGLRRRS